MLGSEEVVAVNSVSLEVRPGQFIAVVGRSGSGKTTLLNLIAGLDQATSGVVLFEGRDLSQMNEKELTEIPRYAGLHKIGPGDGSSSSPSPGSSNNARSIFPLLSAAFENVELPETSGQDLRREGQAVARAART